MSQKGGSVMISLVTIAIIAVAIWLVVKYVKGKKNPQTPVPNSKKSKKNFWILAGIAVGFIILCCVLKKKRTFKSVVEQVMERRRNL